MSALVCFLAGCDDDVFSAVVQADSDVGGDVVFVTDDTYLLYDDDGTELVEASLPSGSPGPPCVADFDEDDSERLVTTLSLPALHAGQLLAGMEIELAPGDGGAHGFVAVIDPEGAVEECDEPNNSTRWTEVYCY